ncbi:hypothetical protein ACFPYM_19965 [Methylobacterium hispanicum]
MVAQDEARYSNDVELPSPGRPNLRRSDMTLALAIPFVEAAAFTVGCALIHGQRHRPERVTFALFGLLCLVALGGLALALAHVGPADPVRATAELPFENHAAGAIRY